MQLQIINFGQIGLCITKFHQVLRVNIILLKVLKTRLYFFIKAEQIQVINAGLKMVENETKINGVNCVVFKKRTTEQNYVRIENSNGCSSYVNFRVFMKSINLI